jgi:hypothetical protein
MATAPLLLFCLGVVVVVALAAFGYVADQRRRERLFAAATVRGWTYTAERFDLVDRWTGQPFGTGDNRRAREVLSGRWGHQDFLSFTYTYETSSTDKDGKRSTTTHRFGVLAWALPAWLPTLEVRPENFMHRAWGAVGFGGDIELESEDFNRAFLVKAADAKYASDVLPPRAMERLLAGPRAAWRIEGNSILSWDDSPFEPDEVERRLIALQGVVSAIPTFVWKDHGYDPHVEGVG